MLCFPHSLSLSLSLSLTGFTSTSTSGTCGDVSLHLTVLGCACVRVWSCAAGLRAGLVQSKAGQTVWDNYERGRELGKVRRRRQLPHPLSLHHAACFRATCRA